MAGESYNEAGWCSICGQNFRRLSTHRCSQRTLNQIDGMHNAAALEPGLERRKPESQRLADGFAMSKQAGSREPQ
jgi:hypothetical protein